MKVMNKFRCAECGCSIQYGDRSTKKYDDEIFCCKECAVEYANIRTVDWGDYDEFKIIEDESNGYGICKIGNGWFSNNRYVILMELDETVYKFDREYEEYFDLQRCASAGRMIDYFLMFDTREDDFVTVKSCDCHKFAHKYDEDECYDKVLDLYIDDRFCKFVFKYIACGVPDEFKAFALDGYLFIDYYGKRAIIAQNLGPVNTPYMYKQIEETLCS